MYPALVVAPKTAKAVWTHEFTKWAPHRAVTVVDGSATKRRQQLEAESDVFVVNWEALRIHSRIATYGSTRLGPGENTPKELNRPWRAVVADEAHRAINPKAKQTRALWAIRDTADFAFPLTGTPIADTPDDFWALLHFINPAEWPSRPKFIDRYCETTWNAFGGVDVVGLKATNRQEFYDLTNPRMLRRPKALVLPWLPEKVYEPRMVEMPPKQARAYKQFKEEMVADLDGGLGTAFDNLSVLTRLSQLASASLEINEDGNIRMVAPSSKVDALVELLEDMGNAPLVVFAQSRQLIDLAAERLERDGITFSTVVGGQSSLIRDTAVEHFMNGDVRVILCTMGAGSESITLTRADTVCFMNRSWSLIENRQAEDRIHRVGQDSNKCVIVDLIAPNTVDEAQHAAVAAKSDRLEEIVRDREALRRML